MGLRDHGFAENGYTILDLFNPAETLQIETYACNWLYQLLEPWVAGDRHDFPLAKYHLWWQQKNVTHSSLFKAASRHCTPDESFANLFVNSSLQSFLTSLGITQYTLWDEGLGWLAFRFIRPGHGDGYPMSCKAWGPAKDVLSLWIPVIGHSPQETLLVVPGSHRKEYKKHLPAETKFTKDEYRLDEPIDPASCLRPKLNPGQAIIFHPRLLHCEDVTDSTITRLNLELRIKPRQWNSEA